MTDTKDFLRGLMGRYTTDNVDDPIAFRKRIDEFLAMDDYEMEGYKSPEMQRDKSVKFQWGHNHDFGDFQLEGVLGDRHIDIIATFIDEFGLPKDLTNKWILDVGVWCGGTTLLLAGMGADVWAVEEVRKYQKCARFLLRSFGLWELPFPPHVYGVSLYEMPKTNAYDYIIFPGVLYHLTDPVLALRILFNALKDGGTLFVETAVLAVANPGKKEIKYLGGENWGWFKPSWTAVTKMLENVGFEEISEPRFTEPVDDRMYISAKRIKHKDMLRAGLSNRYVA